MIIGFTLGRYIGAQFFRTILAMFVTVFILVYMLDFIELMRRAGDAQGASTALMAQLALFRTPSVAEQVLPFAVLFGSMATLLNLSRKLELVVARSAGVSAWQFLQPGISVGIIIGLMSIMLYNPASAYLKQRATEIETKIFAKSGASVSGKDLWIRQSSIDGQAIIRAESAINNSTTLSGVSVFTFDASGSFKERIEASQAILHEGFWEFKNARVMSSLDEPQTYGAYLIATNLNPSQVLQSFTPPDSVSFWALKDVIDRTELAGLDATKYRIQHSILMSRPLLFVAMVLVAASVSLRFFRFGGVAKMVMGGVAAGFVLYVATKLMEDLGASGLVRPVVSAWFTAVVGSLLGTLALLHQEDG